MPRRVWSGTTVTRHKGRRLLMRHARHTRDLSIVNCCACALVAYFCTVPFHEFLHLVTHLAYGNGIVWYSAGAVQPLDRIDYLALSYFDRIMVAGGSASIINALIGVVLFFVLVRARLRPTARVFLTQLMGGQLAQGIGYFLIGGLFGMGDWGNVCSSFPDDPGFATTLRVILAVVGAVGIVATFFALNHLSYHFIEDQHDRGSRLYVALRLHLVMFLTGVVVGPLSMVRSPMMLTGELSPLLVACYSLMWIPFFWGFMFTWVMVRPPRRTRYRYPLPKAPVWPLVALSLALTLVNLLVFGPGIRLG